MLLIQKASQVLLHMSVAFIITFFFTGSVAIGGLAATLEPICNVLLLPLHDKVWDKIRKYQHNGGISRFFGFCKLG